ESASQLLDGDDRNASRIDQVAAATINFGLRVRGGIDLNDSASQPERIGIAHEDLVGAADRDAHGRAEITARGERGLVSTERIDLDDAATATERVLISHQNLAARD